MTKLEKALLIAEAVLDTNAQLLIAPFYLRELIIRVGIGTIERIQAMKTEEDNNEKSTL